MWLTTLNSPERAAALGLATKVRMESEPPVLTVLASLKFGTVVLGVFHFAPQSGSSVTRTNTPRPSTDFRDANSGAMAPRGVRHTSCADASASAQSATKSGRTFEIRGFMMPNE